MARVAYSEDFKLRVLAIASVRGLSHACKTYGVTTETVRAWQAERPDDDKLKLAADLALSELTVEIAEGKGRTRLATHAGILMDKVARYYKPKVSDAQREEEDARQRARDRYGIVHVVARRVAHRMDVPLSELVDVLAETLDLPDLEANCLIAVQSYHQDHGCHWDDNQRPRADCPAPLDNMWTWLESIAPIDEWLQRRSEADHQRMEDQLEANRQAAEASRLAALDAETQALLAAAEAWLRESSDAA